MTQTWGIKRGFTGTGLLTDSRTGKMVMGIVNNGELTIVDDFSVYPEQAAKTNLAETLSNFHRLARNLECGKMELKKGNSDQLPNDFAIQKLQPTNLAESNVITSRIGNGPLHRVAIDLDLDAALIPSSTLDHYHLIIDKAMPWLNYRSLLRELKRTGIIQQGYYWASVTREATVLRTPWTKK